MRLIDADNLILEINKLLKSPYANQSQFGAERREAIETVRDLCVKQEPTAFDIEKVITEFEKKKGTYFDGFVSEGTKIRINDAIDIVKRGGIPAAVQEEGEIK